MLSTPRFRIYVFTYRFIVCRHPTGVDGGVGRRWSLLLCLCSAFVLLLLSSLCSAILLPLFCYVCCQSSSSSSSSDDDDDDDEPTAADLAELYGSAVDNGNPNGAKRLGNFTEGNFTPLSGAAFGPNHNNVTLTADNKVTNADPRINNAVFVPTSGHRHASVGAVYYIGFWGGSWSATASTSDSGHDLQFTPTYIAPQAIASRSYGFSVRCIRD